jgi:hypothetical protein
MVGFLVHLAAKLRCLFALEINMLCILFDLFINFFLCLLCLPLLLSSSVVLLDPRPPAAAAAVLSRFGLLVSSHALREHVASIAGSGNEGPLQAANYYACCAPASLGTPCGHRLVCVFLSLKS